MTEKLTIETLVEATKEDAQQLGILLTDLRASYDGSAVPIERLQSIVDNPAMDQFVARIHGRIVGAATLTAIGCTIDSKAWLEDFVVSAETAVRGRGVGYALWREIEMWCMKRGADLSFSSNSSRQEAHKFYLRQGAKIADTTIFKKTLTDSP